MAARAVGLALDQRRPLAAARPRQACELFIGCEPAGEVVAYLDELTEPYQEQAAKFAQVPHYMLAKFGTGPRLVAAALATDLREGKLRLPRVIVARGSRDLVDFCLEALYPYVSRVVTSSKAT
jgi:hypothetical protein